MVRSLAISAVAVAILSQTAQALVPNAKFVIHCKPIIFGDANSLVAPGLDIAPLNAVTGGIGEGSVDDRPTTCGPSGDTSNYWVPQLYHQRPDGKFDLVKLRSNDVHYTNRVCDYAPGKIKCRRRDYPQAPPAGLKIISGDSERRAYNHSDITQRAISHTCLNQVSRAPEEGQRLEGPGLQTPGLPTIRCDVVRTQVTFPACWDGINLDSPDHKSHMAFPAIESEGGGVCGHDHPFAISQIYTEFSYDTRDFPDSNFVYSQGDSTGNGLYGGFLSGWTDHYRHREALKACKTYNFGGYKCRKTLEKKPKSRSGLVLPNITLTKRDEAVDLHGPFDELPSSKVVTGRNRKGIKKGIAKYGCKLLRLFVNVPGCENLRSKVKNKAESKLIKKDKGGTSRLDEVPRQACKVFRLFINVQACEKAVKKITDKLQKRDEESSRVDGLKGHGCELLRVIINLPGCEKVANKMTDKTTDNKITKREKGGTSRADALFRSGCKLFRLFINVKGCERLVDKLSKSEA